MQDMDRKRIRAEEQLSTQDKPKQHDFAAIGEQIATVLLKAAEDQVVESNNLLESTKVVVEGIKAQVKEQEKLLNEVHKRMKIFGESILEAHKKYLGEKQE
jgi:5-deoxy-D-glucuronate isomerase